MANELSALMREVLASPLGDVIAAVGEGVAEAQEALDSAAVAKTLELYREGGDEMVNLLREIGYQPTFYTLPETVGEVNIAMSLGERATASPTRAPVAARPASGTVAKLSNANIHSALAGRRKLPVRSYATPVDASYANRYSFVGKASTKLTFKVVPVPPPEVMERVRAMPDLVDQEVAPAALALEILELEAQFEDGSGEKITDPDAKKKITATRPEAGEFLTTDDVVTLVLG